MSDDRPVGGTGDRGLDLWKAQIEVEGNAAATAAAAAAVNEDSADILNIITFDKPAKNANRKSFLSTKNRSTDDKNENDSNADTRTHTDTDTGDGDGYSEIVNDENKDNIRNC